jgi:hypothetical protein
VPDRAPRRTRSGSSFPKRLLRRVGRERRGTQIGQTKGAKPVRERPTAQGFAGRPRAMSRGRRGTSAATIKGRSSCARGTLMWPFSPTFRAGVKRWKNLRLPCERSARHRCPRRRSTTEETACREASTQASDQNRRTEMRIKAPLGRATIRLGRRPLTGSKSPRLWVGAPPIGVRE